MATNNFMFVTPLYGKRMHFWQYSRAYEKPAVFPSRDDQLPVMFSCKFEDFSLMIDID